MTSIPPDEKIYRYEKILGFGSHGTTYKAIDLRTNTPVAIKIFGNKDLKGKKHEKELLLQDWQWERKMMAAMLSKCQPHAVCIIDAYIEHGIPRLVMDFVNGPSAHKLLVDNKDPKDRPDAFKLLSDLIHGVQVIHSNGLVHEDIKAENIIYDEDLGIYRYIDFGLSCLQSAQQAAYNRKTGMVNLAKVGFPCSTYGTRYIASPILTKLTERVRRPKVPWSLLQSHDYWAIGIEMLRWTTMYVEKSFYINQYKEWSGKKPTSSHIRNQNLNSLHPFYFMFNPEFLEFQICKVPDKRIRAVLFLLLDMDDYRRFDNFPLVVEIVNGFHDSEILA